MIYRGPGILAVVRLGSSPTPSPPASQLDCRHTGRLRNRDNLLTGGGGRGAESYDRKKAWSSINHSILYALYQRFLNLYFMRENISHFISIFSTILLKVPEINVDLFSRRCSLGIN
jgi:hypothetical protein